MKYSTETTRVPARIWSFGAAAPVEGGTIVQQQHRIGHWYRNTLVYIERRRRERAESALKRHYPELAGIESDIAWIDAEIEKLRAKISEANSIARRKGEAKEMQEQVKALKNDRKPLYADRSRLRSEAFSQPKDVAETRKSMKDLLKVAEKKRDEDAITVARAEYDRAVIAWSRGNPRACSLRSDLAAVDQWANERVKRLRSVAGRMTAMRDRVGGKWTLVPCQPLPWGVRGEIELAMAQSKTGAPPEFVRWRDRGASTVQVQGGTTPAEVMAGECTQLSITPPDESIRERRRAITAELDTLAGSGDIARRQALRDQLRSLDGRARVSVRIGSNPDRTPIFATAPMILHRPLPNDARIKLASLRMDRGSWKMQFTMTRESWAKGDEATTGRVAIDIGWRLTDDGLRVAYWVGDDGQEGELVIPARNLASFDESPKLRSVRDNNFNSARKCLLAWLAGAPIPPDESSVIERVFGRRADRMESDPKQAKYSAYQRECSLAWRRWREDSPVEIPTAIRERLRYLAQYKSTARLANDIEWWRNNRFRGDGHAFDAMDGWRKQDLHLHRWESNGLSQAVGWRKDFYRCFAAFLRRRYATVVVEDVDLKKLQATEKPEDAAKPGGVTEHARTASLSVLRQALAGSMKVEKAEAANSTRLHHDCGHLNQWKDAAGLHQTCEQCGVVFDQDRNAALNLLHGTHLPGPVAAK